MSLPYLRKIEREYKKTNPDIYNFLAAEYQASPKWDKNMADREAELSEKYDDCHKRKEKYMKLYYACEIMFVIFAIILFLFFFLAPLGTVRNIILSNLIGLVLLSKACSYMLSYQAILTQKEIDALIYPEFCAAGVGPTQYAPPVSAANIDLF